MAQEKKLNPLLFFGIIIGLSAIIWFVLPERNDSGSPAEVQDSLKVETEEDTSIEAEETELPYEEIVADARLKKDWSVLVKRYVNAKYKMEIEDLDGRMFLQLNVEDDGKDISLIELLDKCDSKIDGVLERILDKDGSLITPTTRAELNTATIYISELETAVEEAAQLLSILEKQAVSYSDSIQ